MSSSPMVTAQRTIERTLTPPKPGKCPGKSHITSQICGRSRAITPADPQVPSSDIFQTWTDRRPRPAFRLREVSLLNLEIVGLSRSSKDRSCTIHECCGEHVEAGSLLRVVPAVFYVEEVVKCIHVYGGSDGCTVGFVPRYFAEAVRAKSREYSFV
jgi:hypothetical protein